MTVFVKNDIAMPPISVGEVLRYAECPKDAAVDIPECPKTSPTVCFATLSVTVSGDECDFGYFKVKSSGLAKNLSGCERVLVFCATAGIDFDREIRKYTRINPSRAYLLSAVGDERIEALCDSFIKEYEEENGVYLKPRFSAGYGDLPLDVQKDIFTLLEPSKRIGVSLTSSLLMTPTKSVTAFAGIK